VDFDLAAVGNAASQRGPAERAECSTCNKQMYKMPLYPNEPAEWKHTSSGAPMSWSPERHLAGTAMLQPHNHRFPKVQPGKVSTCEVNGCGASLKRFDSVKVEPIRNAKEEQMYQSRLRGAATTSAKKKRHPNQKALTIKPGTKRER
jgi:hypothetical protein